MPTIRRSAPLTPEGEYVGQATGVSQAWSKPKINPDGSKSESYQMFKIPLRIPGGQFVTTFARVTENTGWVFEQICKSGELILPDGAEFVITADDLERRRFYFGVRHKEYNGTKIADIRFHTKTYACEVNPSLENVTFPNEAPRGVTLRSAASPASPPPEASTRISEPSIKPSGTGSSPIGDLETLSDDDFAQAIEHAKELRRKKE